MKSVDEELSCGGELIEMPSVEHCGMESWHVAKPLNWRSFDGPVIHLFSHGGATFEFDEYRAVNVSAGKFFLTAPYQRYRAENGIMTPGTRFWISFNPNYDAELKHSTLSRNLLCRLYQSSEEFNGIDLFYSRSIEALLKRFRSAMIEREHGADPDIINAEIRTILCSIIISVFRSLPETRDQQVEDSVQTSIAFLESHFLEDIIIDDMISELGLKKTAYFHRFREITGYTPKDYLHRFRIQHAQKLMHREEFNITQIAFDSGFNSSAYFSVAFKKHTLQTPRQYRNAILGNADAVSQRKPNNTIPIDLMPYFNVNGIYDEGSRFGDGIDECGYAYSSSVVPSPLFWNGVEFRIGQANRRNVVSDSGQEISVDADKCSELLIIASAPYADVSLTVTLNYRDGSNVQYTQMVSNWCFARSFPNEAIAATLWHRLHCDGTVEPKVCYLYGYSFHADSKKVLRSITLSNTGKIVILSMAVRQTA